MSWDTPFDKPRQHLSWARQAIEEMDAAFVDFLESKPQATIVEHDPETGNEIHKVRLVKSFPDILSRRAHEALITTRHAFDQTLFAGNKIIGHGPVKNG